MMKELAKQSYKVALIGLDMSGMDEHIIRYAASISKFLAIERIIFVHVAKELQLPEELVKEYPDLVDPLDETIEAEIMTKVEKHFGSTDVDTSCIITEGHPIDKILKLSKVKNVDLIMMGRKKSLDGSGIVSSRIARKCHCSMLFIPEEASTDIQKLLLPVDFSHHAALGLGFALDLNQKSGVKMALINVYHIPIGYYRTGKTYEEFASIMKSFAEKDCQRFLKEYEFHEETSCDFLPSKNGDSPELIYEFATKNEADMIIIGSRGRTGIASLLMGSVAEKLVYLDSSIPIFVIKEKGENMGFLDALMKL